MIFCQPYKVSYIMCLKSVLCYGVRFSGDILSCKSRNRNWYCVDVFKPPGDIFELTISYRNLFYMVVYSLTINRFQYQCDTILYFDYCTPISFVTACFLCQWVKVNLGLRSHQS